MSATKIVLIVLLALLITEDGLVAENKTVFVRSKDYEACLERQHIFPVIKHQRLYYEAAKEGILKEEEVVEPPNPKR